MRISAAAALGRIGPAAKEAIPLLRGLLNDPAMGEPTIMGRGVGKESVSNAAANAIRLIEAETAADQNWRGPNSGSAGLDPRRSGPLAQSIFGEVLSINPIISENVNRWGMKATNYATPSVIPGTVDLQSTRAKLTLDHGRERSIISAVFVSALLTSGCQTFNMSPEKFAEQQKGR